MTVITSKASGLSHAVRRGTSAATVLLCLGLVSGAVADSRPQHYDSAAPASVKEAELGLAEAVKAISAAFAARDFESVHKTSYKAEKAAAVLADAPSVDPGLSENLAHTIEIVHQASEIPSEPILAVAVPALEDVTRKTLASLKATN